LHRAKHGAEVISVSRAGLAEAAPLWTDFIAQFQRLVDRFSHQIKATLV